MTSIPSRSVATASFEIFILVGRKYRKSSFNCVLNLIVQNGNGKLKRKCGKTNAYGLKLLYNVI